MAGIVLYILQTFPVSVSIVSIGCVLLAACPHKASNTRYSTVVCFQFLSPYTIAQRTMQHFINYLHCGVHTPKFSVSTYMYVGLLYMLCILSVVHNTSIRIYVDRNPLLYDPVKHIIQAVVHLYRVMHLCVGPWWSGFTNKRAPLTACTYVLHTYTLYRL